MSAAIHLAGPDDLPALLPMVAAFHEEEGIAIDDETTADAVRHMIEDEAAGCLYLIGPRRAPIGYLAVSFFRSITLGGPAAYIDQFFIRPGVRGRGVGSEVLTRLLPTLEKGGLAGIHLDVGKDRPRLEQFYRRAGFRPNDGYRTMSRLARR